jgi:amicyanin
MSSMPAPSSGPGEASGANTPVAGNAVNIAQFAFSPASLSVKVGTTVTWTNNDSEPHTVTSTNNSGPLKSPAMKSGDTYTFTFTTAGTFDYLCTIHPFMTATVVVTP